MVTRHVYMRLEESHRGGTALSEVMARSRALAELSSVQGLRLLRPADDNAAAAWDICLVLTFESLSDYETFRDDPAHRRFTDEFLASRLKVIKAWNLKE